jgi:CO/xanthine dehydrogenase Mo-binding subunit
MVSEVVTEALKVVGQSPVHKGVEALVAGQAKFTGDFYFPGLLLGGVRLRELPLTPEKVLQALREKLKQ